MTIGDNRDCIRVLLYSYCTTITGIDKGTLLGTPNREPKEYSRNRNILTGVRIFYYIPIREPKEYSRNIVGIYLPGSLYSIIFLLDSWGSLFGVPSKVPYIEERDSPGGIASSPKGVYRKGPNTQ